MNSEMEDSPRTSMALAYKMKKRKSMCAHGGMPSSCPKCGSGESAERMMREDEMPEEMSEKDMVARIMKKRGEQMLSKGGRVANEDSMEADFAPNEFDDLHLRDDLESSYTGENSGDFLSSKDEDERKRDLVSRIMVSRRKKDRNPSPA